jgi:hypothetical protein
MNNEVDTRREVLVAVKLYFGLRDGSRNRISAKWVQQILPENQQARNSDVT